MALPMPHRTFTVEEYLHLAETGFFRDDERIELIDGELIEMPPPNPPHVRGINALTRLLVVALLDEPVEVSVQNPVVLPRGVPLPDLAVFRLKPAMGLPSAEDVPLVIEVADSTLRTDRSIKFPRYAAAGIAEAWLIDINGRTVERHTEPSAGGYSLLAVARRGESLASTVFPSLIIPVDVVFASIPADDGGGGE